MPKTPFPGPGAEGVVGRDKVAPLDPLKMGWRDSGATGSRTFKTNADVRSEIASDFFDPKVTKENVRLVNVPLSDLKPDSRIIPDDPRLSDLSGKAAVVLERMPDGTYSIRDGNHRIAQAMGDGYTHVPAWVVDRAPAASEITDKYGLEAFEIAAGSSDLKKGIATRAGDIPAEIVRLTNGPEGQKYNSYVQQIANEWGVPAPKVLIYDKPGSLYKAEFIDGTKTKFGDVILFNKATATEKTLQHEMAHYLRLLGEGTSEMRAKGLNHLDIPMDTMAHIIEDTHGKKFDEAFDFINQTTKKQP